MAKQYEVTIKIEEVGHSETVMVSAQDEWKARTAAMFACTYPIKGEHVEYIVNEIR